MAEKEGRQEGLQAEPATLDTYNPISDEDAKLWREKGISVPKHADLTAGQVFRHEVSLWSGKQVVALVTLVHQDYPGTTVQWQMIVDGQPDRVVTAQHYDDEVAEPLPKALLEYLYKEEIEAILWETLYYFSPIKFTSEDVLPI